jgi:hypothetical protein
MEIEQNHAGLFVAVAVAPDDGEACERRTLAPRWAKPSALARPMPPPPPVISATLPVNSITLRFPSRDGLATAFDPTSN